MVKVWLGNIAPLLESSKLKHYYHQLPDHRREKADRQRVPLKKAQSVGAWVLWSNIKEQYGLGDESVYNLSHSGDFVLCAALTNEEAGGQTKGSQKGPGSYSFEGTKLGCDIEKIREVKESLPKRFFTLSERVGIEQESTKKRQREMFFRLWVLKESYMKATGQGMKLDMRSFEIQLGDLGPRVKQPRGTSPCYHLHELPIPSPEYLAAVCTTSEDVDIKVHEFVF